MKRILYSIVLFALAAPAYSGYDSNLDGVVSQVLTYANGRVYFVMENQPASHPVCDRRFFAIDYALPEDIRHQLLSRLLTAKATGKTLRIGCDGAGDCAHGKIRVHRIG